MKTLRYFSYTKKLLDLKSDFDEEGTYSLIRANSEFKSGNAWGLIFAIFIASIGLNVNSTAVIIGAMLISPLMGPIVGAGFSLGTHDFDLFKRSIKNLSYAVLISVLTSTLFFLISPSGSEKSELLARTQPTFYDVLIAFFGGAAGIVASTRLSKGNAIPGVAIATALMPPLCTVGFFIGHFELRLALGAFYLFLINAVFILIATYLFTRLLGFRLFVDRDIIRDKKIHRYMTIGAFSLIIPSLFMAWYLQKKSQFENSAELFISSEFDSSSSVITKKEIVFDIRKPKINIYLLGQELDDDRKNQFQKNILGYKNLNNTELNIVSVHKDKLSINELEEKFVKKSDIVRFFNNESTFHRNSKELASDEILKQLSQEMRDRISSIEVNGLHVRVIWKLKPNINKINLIELEIYRRMSNVGISVDHSLMIKK